MAEKKLVSAECPRCGTLTLEAGELSCAAEPRGDRGLCEFRCPYCSMTVLVRTNAEGVAAVLEAGGRPARTLPFEVLERHEGLAISSDELLAFHERLLEICCVPPEIERAA